MFTLFLVNADEFLQVLFLTCEVYWKNLQ